MRCFFFSSSKGAGTAWSRTRWTAAELVLGNKREGKACAEALGSGRLVHNNHRAQRSARMEERATGATGGGNQEDVANKGGAQSEGISTADDEKELNVDCDAGNANAQEGEDTMEAAQARKEAKMKRREERRVAHWQHRRQKRREKKQEIQRLEQEAIARGEQPPERKKKKNPRIRTSVPLEKNHPRLVIDLDFQDFLNEKVQPNWVIIAYFVLIILVFLMIYYGEASP
jgi:hypothetical protein